METNSAAEQLQVIRTLMERAALYRRALAPTMLTTGSLGTAAAVAGWVTGIASLQTFVLFWMLVSVLALGTSLLLVRRQALKEAETFWSPPTRRVAQAFLPPLFAGLVVALLGIRLGSEFIQPWAIPALWMLLYGCALHAAGFFMTRGIRLFGWGFLLCGTAFCGWHGFSQVSLTLRHEHLVMGATFGVLHLAYGIYLHFTEQSEKAS
jgi:hypothetical protein